MTLNDFLTYLTQATILVIAVLTLADYLRHRDQARLDITLLFTALALNVIVPRLAALLNIESPWTTKLSQIMIMTHPFLLLRLVAHFRIVHRQFYWFTLGGLLLTVVLLVTYRKELNPFAGIYMVIYFIIVELYAIAAFFREAQFTKGVTHYRLLLVAYGSGLLAGAIALLGLNIAFPGRPALQGVVNPLVQFVAVLAMVSYYLGFAPPARLRRAWQLSELHHFLRQATGPWTGEPAAVTLERLSKTAVRATGGLAALVSLWNETTQKLEFKGASNPTVIRQFQPGKLLYNAWAQRRPLLLRFPADFSREDSEVAHSMGAQAILSVPIRTGEHSWGLLVVYNWRTPLFAADDLELMELLAEQTAIVLGYAQLLGEQRALVDELRHRGEQLEVAYKELESFSYSVSHDLRAPLRHVAGYVQLMQKHTADSLDEKGQRYLTVILEAATRMGRLIDDLLAFSRFGRADLKMGQVDMAQLVSEVRSELEPETAGRQVVWNIHQLPLVAGDPSLLKLVLTNLIANALKFTHARSPALIEIGYTNSGEEVAFFVRDNGVGFDMQYADKLFGVFQRLHNDPNYPGTGIGLANVRRIIQRHGGRVWAESTLDQGATFYFALPLGQGTLPVEQGTLPNGQETMTNR
jgi:signal transduction histidine kinase